MRFWNTFIFFCEGSVGRWAAWAKAPARAAPRAAASAQEAVGARARAWARASVAWASASRKLLGVASGVWLGHAWAMGSAPATERRGHRRGNKVGLWASARASAWACVADNRDDDATQEKAVFVRQHSTGTKSNDGAFTSFNWRRDGIFD
jgi:hypothetical protein